MKTIICCMLSSEGTIPERSIMLSAALVRRME